ncbi:hypothetical protein FAZ95_14610 [Trinickia violacea]|uniref:Uncharacterized protein n=1 Tax=Trinickia violacea TaxID=2571746 RepID=A0A4P8ISP8_9BURK|nr:hypothetical protein [Trinickia violacea]QCP50293.1 hypothetical protein FAZ95_14610 [Trinickia violacea]
MKLDASTFRRLRRLTPILDDILNAGEVEYVGQAVSLTALATLCSELFEAYEREYPDEVTQARIDSLESQ